MKNVFILKEGDQFHLPIRTWNDRDGRERSRPTFGTNPKRSTVRAVIILEKRATDRMDAESDFCSISGNFDCRQDVQERLFFLCFEGSALWGLRKPIVFQWFLIVLMSCECPSGRFDNFWVATARHRENPPSAPTPIHTPPIPTLPEQTHARAPRGWLPINIEIIHKQARGFVATMCHPGEPAIHIATQCQNNIFLGGGAKCGNHCFHTNRRATTRWPPSRAVLVRRITYFANSDFRWTLLNFLRLVSAQC